MYILNAVLVNVVPNPFLVCFYDVSPISCPSLHILYSLNSMFLLSFTSISQDKWVLEHRDIVLGHLIGRVGIDRNVEMTKKKKTIFILFFFLCLLHAPY